LGGTRFAGSLADRRRLNARAAAKIVLAPAVAADDANRPPVRIDDDDVVQAVGLALAAEILDGFAGAISPWRRHEDV